MELVIMAAGMGSRFGGLKQIEPIDKNNNFIIDYSIFDAIRCGFDKVIFIIKEENFEIFKSTVGSRIEKFIETKYIFQNNNNVPSQYKIPETRKKPLGTSHAVLCAAPEITSGFIVINADDFYGYDAFKTAAEFLKTNTDPNKYALIGYEASKTIGNNGSVKRGICKLNGGNLYEIEESVIEKDEAGNIFATPLENPEAPKKLIANNTPVSMNMFAFTKDFTKHLQTGFDKFLETHKDDLSTAENLLPRTLTDLISAGEVVVEMHPTIATWYGITYKEDKPDLVASIQKMIDMGEYPTNLWNN